MAVVGSTAALKLLGVSRDFIAGGQRVRALQRVSFEVRKGSYVAIMGTSGSGKSTLMNILGLLDRPTAGQYLLLGRDVSRLGDDDRAGLRAACLGFVFQNFHLLPRTSALDNVALPLIYRGVGKAERRKRAIEALDRVSLADRAHHTPQQLSGGQQQRVAIARALVGHPEVLLADEPTGNLDTRTTQDMLALFGQLHQEGLTVVLVTHELEVALCAARLLTFQDGALVSDGSPKEAP